MSDLLSIDEALALVLARAEPLPAEAVPLDAAAGRVLAEAGTATVDLPPFASSAMDGFALRAVDTPGRLAVVGQSAAGRPASRSVASGEAVGISTGAVVPDGADAVIPVEYVVQYDNFVQIGEFVASGANIRPRGGDVAVGGVLVEPGTRLGPTQLGALAAGGVAAPVCTRRPRAAVLSTGSELRPPGQPLERGQIYEANGPILAAMLAAAGAEVELLAPAGDDPDEHRAALERGLAVDVLVTSGGVSVGPHDLVRRIASELGVEEVFWRVAVKPGKPISFGTRGSTLVFALPGNPVSSLVGCELFVRPALLALQGARDPGPRYEPVRLASALRRGDDRDELVRARLDVRDDAVWAVPLSGQESHMIARAAAADALVLVPRGTGELAAGSVARALRLAR